jgi:hypothetical protein
VLAWWMEQRSARPQVSNEPRLQQLTQGWDLDIRMRVIFILDYWIDLKFDKINYDNILYN